MSETQVNKDARIATGSAGHGVRGGGSHQPIPKFIITTATKHLHEYGIAQRALIVGGMITLATLLLPVLFLVMVRVIEVAVGVLW